MSCVAYLVFTVVFQRFTIFLFLPALVSFTGRPNFCSTFFFLLSSVSCSFFFSFPNIHNKRYTRFVLFVYSLRKSMRLLFIVNKPFSIFMEIVARRFSVLSSTVQFSFFIFFYIFCLRCRSPEAEVGVKENCSFLFCFVSRLVGFTVKCSRLRKRFLLLAKKKGTC